MDNNQLGEETLMPEVLYLLASPNALFQRMNTSNKK